jgi:hypothetical protein
MTNLIERFKDLALANPINAAILERLPLLGAAEPWLTAGCLYQAVWNARDGKAPGWGIKDYDIFYWDEDTSWEAEDVVIRRADMLFADLGAAVEIRNQARVPLWYEAKFGAPCPPVTCPEDGIGRFPVACTCVGLAPSGEVYAPYGLDDMFAGRLKLNPNTPNPRLFRAKAETYHARWPWLEIIDPA